MTAAIPPAPLSRIDTLKPEEFLSEPAVRTPPAIDLRGSRLRRCDWYRTACNQELRSNPKEEFSSFELAAVCSVEAEDNYVLVRHRYGSCLLRDSISEVSDKLAPRGFVRIHRSVLINPAFIEEIRPQSTGTDRLKVRGGKEYIVTRNLQDEHKIFGRVLGNDPGAEYVKGIAA
jgi:DNA-binding LytR/AlgR family response regulator